MVLLNQLLDFAGFRIADADELDDDTLGGADLDVEPV